MRRVELRMNEQEKYNYGTNNKIKSSMCILYIPLLLAY